MNTNIVPPQLMPAPPITTHYKPIEQGTVRSSVEVAQIIPNILGPPQSVRETIHYVISILRI
jgi:hypothetical protein